MSEESNKTEKNKPSIDYGTCECCNKEPAIGVASMSIAWGKNCLEANVVPYQIAVYNTAMVGGYNLCADWWKELVKNTLSYFEKTEKQFNEDVKKEIKTIDNSDASIVHDRLKEIEENPATVVKGKDLEKRLGEWEGTDKA
jgi:uncharacterized protein YktA (UPF0223 family)